MGKWSVKYFDKDVLPENCILIAGTTKDDLKNTILSNYQSVVELQHCLFEAYECTKNNVNTLVIFQLISAVLIADLLHYLHDGQVKNVVFIGAAFSFKDQLSIGSIVIPTSVKPLDGIVDYIEQVSVVKPSNISLRFIKDLFVKNSINHIEGLTVSVPSVFVKPKNMIIDNEIVSMEMECASLYFYSSKLGINSVAIQVISDNKGHQLYSTQDARYKTIEHITMMLSKEKKLV